MKGATSIVRDRIRRKAVWGACIAVLMSAILMSACGSQVLEGQAASYLIVDGIEAASGAEPQEFGAVLHSDVVTLVEVPGFDERQPTVFSDPARVTMRLGLKDPGPPTSPTVPSINNAITVNRYRIVYTRTDGRNTPGVDVPHPFDGEVTFTVSGTTAVTAGFLIVRHSAKYEAPLRAMAVGGGAGLLTTNAEITFYGHDQTGRLVTTTARMTVIFGNFGDPE
jgi:hypothetical protein